MALLKHKIGPREQQRRVLAQAFLKPGHASLKFIETPFDLRLAVALAVQLVVNPGSKLRQLVAEHTEVVVDLPSEKINFLLHILAQRLESVFKRIESVFKRIQSGFKRFESVFKRFESVFERIQSGFKRFESVFERIESSFKRLESFSKPDVGLTYLLHVNNHLGELLADGVKHLLDPHLQAPFSR